MARYRKKYLIASLILKDLKVNCESYNFGKLLNDSLSAYKDDEEGDTKQLKNLIFEYFVIRRITTLGGLDQVKSIQMQQIKDLLQNIWLRHLQYVMKK